MEIETRQPKAIHFFKKQLQKDKVSHAYLLVGAYDTFAFAEYMAMSLSCETSREGACGTCSACKRIKENVYPDYEVLQGAIKKEDILQLQRHFTQTALEKNGHKTYVLCDVDAATPVALNSLLKFLEEPSSTVTAILTTSNENRVLETIRSRCLNLYLEKPSQATLIKAIDHEALDFLDAYFLSVLQPDLQGILETSQTKEYQHFRDFMVDWLELLNMKSLARALIFLQQEGIKQKVLNKDNFADFCNLASHILFENKNETIQNVVNHVPSATKQRIAKALLAAHDQLMSGVNLGLLVDSLSYQILYQKEVDYAATVL